MHVRNDRHPTSLNKKVESRRQLLADKSERHYRHLHLHEAGISNQSASCETQQSGSKHPSVIVYTSNSKSWSTSHRIHEATANLNDCRKGLARIRRQQSKTAMATATSHPA
jgi:hypothetical protein